MVDYQGIDAALSILIMLFSKLDIRLDIII